jgi:membrane protein implicated in regulation of membrane protease activity
MSPSEFEHPTDRQRAAAKEPGGRYTRWAAAAILVPTVPMLLLSVAALAVFYAAPTRFGRLLAQLPGEEIIRSLLVFAPATLLGIVILAALYALERPQPEAQREPSPVQKPRQAQRPREAGLSQIAAWLLPPSGLLLLAAIAGRLLAFVSPERWQALLAPLPGDRYLSPLFAAAPWVLLVIVAVLTVIVWRSRSRRPHRPPDQRRAARIGAVATLIAALPLLGLSLTALVAFAAAHDRFERVLARLTQEAFLRLGLVFTPAALLSLVLLALLVLFFSAMGREMDRSSATPSTQPPAAWRQNLAVWVLTAGLTFSAILGLGLGGVAIYLVIR